MVLYTCAMGGHDVPGPIDVHPCAKAMKALDRAGVSYEHRTVGGIRALPWTLRSADRDEVRERTGQSLVPVLVLDDGTAIHGSATIVDWARSHAP
ncbi:MAG: glutathione S-transferase N-terminal domain-containing protein [Patulibacter minatonensis]